MWNFWQNRLSRSELFQYSVFDLSLTLSLDSKVTNFKNYFLSCCIQYMMKFWRNRSGRSELPFKQWGGLSPQKYTQFGTCWPLRKIWNIAYIMNYVLKYKFHIRTHDARKRSQIGVFHVFVATTFFRTVRTAREYVFTGLFFLSLNKFFFEPQLFFSRFQQKIIGWYPQFAHFFFFSRKKKKTSLFGRILEIFVRTKNNKYIRCDQNFRKCS